MTKEATKSNKPWYKTWKVILVALIGFMIVTAALAPQPTENKQTSTPQKPAEQKTQLNADVTYNASAITLTNKETQPWGRCEYSLNNKYSYSGGTVIIPVGTPTNLALADFTHNNKRFNIYEEKPDYLKVKCYRDGTEYTDGDYFFN